MEDLDVDILSNHVGGRYRLVVLMQKRLRAHQQGLPALVPDMEGISPHMVAAEEIRQDKIWLIMGEEAEKIRKARRAADQKAEKPAAPPEKKSLT
jgi:DNA-directed RNA polymerase subunit K/omega